MNKTVVSLMVGALMLLVASCGQAGPLVVDNFDTGSKPNKLGADFGSWDKDPNDQTQGCQMSFDSTIKHGDSGYSCRLDYDVESPNPAYNGFWMKLNNLDGRKHKYLVMYVKGDTEKGFTSQFKVELKNKNEVGKYLVTGINDSWQKIKIPIKKFRGLTDFSALTEVIVVFDDINSTERYGALNIDDIYFE
ncbi:MAG: carbohydrate binding domain-containing protein [Candidatus Ancaeobacter aquaticus]|nr:carbohydrate binding domain-containing protein [Candidatus Ancaeobacter aquaticus]